MTDKWIAVWIVTAIGFVGTTDVLAGPPSSKPVVFYGSQAGRPTFDEDAHGGNAFATVLVQLLGRESLTFAELKSELVTLTVGASRRRQTPEIVGGDHLREWQLIPKPRAEKWVALVVVFSDYSKGNIRSSLPGAKRDLSRVADALSKAGFDVVRSIDPNEESLRALLAKYRKRTVSADVSLIYTTGHGYESDGAARLILPYPKGEGDPELRLSSLASNGQARRANLVFYAACRNRGF